MGMDLELEWEEPGWQRMMDSLPRGSVIPAERFFAMLGAVDEEGALEAALTLTARGVGLDVSRLPHTFLPSRARPTPKLTVVVVLPVPPF